MMQQTVFHIGYHKTATSWMQRKLFQPAHGFRPVANHAEVFAHIVQPLAFDFDPSVMRDLLAARADGGGVPMVSSEVLSGHPFLGGREADVYAQRIQQIAPDAKILITLRNQMQILPSVYMQYLRRGGTLSYPAFFAGTDEPGYFGFSPLHFAYDRLVALYQSLFGADNVVVFAQERLKADIDGSVGDLVRDLGNDTFTGLIPDARAVNAASYPEAAVPMLRRANHVRASTLNPNPIVNISGIERAAGGIMRRLPITSKPVSAYVAREFAGYYDASNVRLTALVGQPLGWDR
jgi:hypothetical protein